jgi:hypothetical protein
VTEAKVFVKDCVLCCSKYGITIDEFSASRRRTEVETGE